MTDWLYTISTILRWKFQYFHKGVEHVVMSPTMNDYLIASAKESLTNTKLLRLGLGHQFTRKLWQLVTSLLFLASLPPLMEQPEPPQQQRHANWDDALEECLASSQEDERSVEGADACRSSTSDDEDDPSEIHWWLPRLKTASKKALPNMAFPNTDESQAHHFWVHWLWCGDFSFQG